MSMNLFENVVLSLKSHLNLLIFTASLIDRKGKYMKKCALKECLTTKKIMESLQDFLGNIPQTREKAAENPVLRARQIATQASAKSAAISGALALPPGPLGALTIIPDLIAVWKIQAQMVADIAGAFGKENYLSREQMLYCLFRHTAAQAMRDIAVRVGERMLVRRATLKVLESSLQKIGVRLTQRLLGKSVTRWLGPLAALGVAAYSYYDTGKVAQSSIDFFGSDLSIGSEEDFMIFRH